MWWLKITNEGFWLSGKDLTVMLASYFLGCFTSGYYLVRFRTGEDIRQRGSGNVGARNVGRTIGPLGFTITFLLDFAKGALATQVAAYFNLGAWGVVLAMWAVVIGHIWPVQLRFHGGKGIATSLGVLIVYDWSMVLVIGVLFMGSLVFTRRFTLSGLLAYAMSPLVIFAYETSIPKMVGLTVLVILILIAHRTDIREEMDRGFWRGEMKEKRSNPP
jgi:acyl phosphate:glycerol-3-phosphate acyltransferase